MSNFQPIAASELIINPDGSIYHLNLLPEHIADTIITVGDPDRVQEVSKHFDSISATIHKREFVSHIGRVGNQQITVLSTGIGTDNIDICLNEIDALANINFSTRLPNPQPRQLRFIRIGTSGCLDPNIPVDSLLMSRYAVGLEGMMLFYDRQPSEDEQGLQTALSDYAERNQISLPIAPVATTADLGLVQAFPELAQGITLTATGFYSPQGRQLRARSLFRNGMEQLNGLAYRGLKVSNFEMETAGIYGLASLLGHKALSLSALVANRATGEFSQNPHEAVQKLIVRVLESLPQL